MAKRAVFLEKTFLGFAGLAGMYHYAVRVGYGWYEVEPIGDSKLKERRNSINGSLDGHPKMNRATRLSAMRDVCAGATCKTDDEILAFNIDWIERHPTYGLMSTNCQKYALDLIQFLVGGTFKMEIPLASENAWAGGPGSHAISTGGYRQARATTGKAGAQFGVLAVEAEGPSAGAEVNDGGLGQGTEYLGFEASLGRVEARVWPAIVRVEPNLNTGFGYDGDKIVMKLAGFGFTFGITGASYHTPVGSIGLGKM